MTSCASSCWPDPPSGAAAATAGSSPGLNGSVSWNPGSGSDGRRGVVTAVRRWSRRREKLLRSTVPAAARLVPGLAVVAAAPEPDVVPEPDPEPDVVPEPDPDPLAVVVGGAETDADDVELGGDGLNPCWSVPGRRAITRYCHSPTPGECEYVVGGADCASWASTSADFLSEKSSSLVFVHSTM